LAIAAARTLYAEIGAEIARNDFDTVSRRAVVSSARKLAQAPAIVSRSLAPPSDLSAPPLAQAQFLIDALGFLPPIRSAMPALQWWRLCDRAVWVIALFERLERREQVRRSGA
jgi:phytoene synthase